MLERAMRGLHNATHRSTAPRLRIYSTMNIRTLLPGRKGQNSYVAVRKIEDNDEEIGPRAIRNLQFFRRRKDMEREGNGPGE